MEKTFIEKLQQIEKLKLYDLLCENSVWKSKDINQTMPHTERLWCQLGNYRIYLHFIHPCAKEDVVFFQNNFPSAVHVIDGEYRLEISSDEHSEVFSKIIAQGSMYYEVPKEKWIYIRPTAGVCSSVMITMEPEEDGENMGDSLHNDRVFVMLEYFKGKYRHTVKVDNILEQINRGDWVMLDERKMDRDDREEYGAFIGIKGFVIKNSKDAGLSIRFGNDRVDEFNHKVLMKLNKPDE